MICDLTTRVTIRDLRNLLRERGINDMRNIGIEFAETAAGFGGARSWFVCPACERRCGVLYLVRPAIWQCRICAQGRYASETESPLDRLYRKARKLRRRLGQFDGNMMLPFPGKPKGMHWSTYLRLRGEGLATEQQLAEILRARLHR